jgi:hypothetical protein
MHCSCWKEMNLKGCRNKQESIPVHLGKHHVTVAARIIEKELGLLIDHH